MERVVDITLEAVNESTTTVSSSKLKRLLSKTPAWNIEQINGYNCLCREFSFEDYPDTIGFANCVAGIADSDQHYPMILIGEKTVKVYWTTKQVNGIHENDFIMAAKVDEIL